MSSAEAAELSKLAETTYRDVNIAFANELAAYASRVGVDVLEAIRPRTASRTATSTSRASASAGTASPSTRTSCCRGLRRWSWSGFPGASTTGRWTPRSTRLRDELGGLRDVPVLVLGLTYREGVKELAYSRAIPLLERLAEEGARVEAWDPLLSAAEIEALGRRGLDLGHPERRARDRHPDGRSGLRPARPRRGSRRSRSSSTAGTACETSPSRRASACSAWASRPAPGRRRSRVAPMTRHRCPHDHVMELRGLLTVHAHPDGGAI